MTNILQETHTSMKAKPYKTYEPYFEETIQKINEEAYLHINNGGVTVDCYLDKNGSPVLNIKASHFGNKTNDMEIKTSQSGLLSIVDTILKFIYDHPNAEVYKYQDPANPDNEYTIDFLQNRPSLSDGNYIVGISKYSNNLSNTKMETED